MNAEIAKEIQAEQDHGRRKYGRGPKDFEHDDDHEFLDWNTLIDDHNRRAAHGTPMEYRQYLIKVAGLAVSAVESFDRRTLRTFTIPGNSI